MTPAVETLIAALDDLTETEMVAFHKEVCRRAAKVYAPRYASIQRRNYEAAMAFRDTRFQKGLSVLENITRCIRPA